MANRDNHYEAAFEEFLRARQVPAHSADGVYPSLGWQPKAARTAVMRLAAAAPWFQVWTCLCPPHMNPFLGRDVIPVFRVYGQGS